MTSFLKHRKLQVFPMVLGVFPVLKIVDKFIFIYFVLAILRSLKFVTLQIVKQFLFNIGFFGLAAFKNLPKRLNLSRFFYVVVCNRLNHVNN